MNSITEETQLFEKIYPSKYPPQVICFSRYYVTWFAFEGEIVEESSSPNIAMNVEVRLMSAQILYQQDVLLIHNVITSLLDNRDFLGYQLSYYKGNLTEKQFDSIKSKYLTPNDTYEVDALATNILLLMKNTSIVFDADEISTIFKCDIDVAEDALTKIMNNLKIMNSLKIDD